MKVNRSTYYHYIFRRPQKKQFELEDEKLRPMIKEIFEESKERFGSRKIRAVLLQKGIRASEKKISRLMKEMELVCKQVRLRYWSSTLRKYKCYDNKVKQEFVQPEPNLVWVSDITYVRVKNRFCYVCIVIDLFSRRVLARRTAKEITSDLVWKTFEEAFERRKRPAGVTFHSDQGCQYTDFNFRKCLRQLGVIQSFSRPGTPLDNAVAESFFACMKREELSHNYYDTIEALEQAVSEYVEFYNSVRIHERLGYLTPIQVEENFYALKENKPVLWKCPNETVQNTVSVSVGGGEVNNHTMENKLKNLCYPFIQNRLCQFSSANAHREIWGIHGAFLPFRGAKMGQISKCQSAVAGQRVNQHDRLFEPPDKILYHGKRICQEMMRKLSEKRIRASIEERPESMIHIGNGTMFRNNIELSFGIMSKIA